MNITITIDIIMMIMNTEVIIMIVSVESHVDEPGLEMNYKPPISNSILLSINHTL